MIKNQKEYFCISSVLILDLESDWPLYETKQKSMYLVNIMQMLNSW